MTSSLTLPMPPASDAAGWIADAVSAVAEQSFFALVDMSGPPRLDESGDRWLMSTVRFDDGVVTGSLACWMPTALAHVLYDAFSGRDPAEAAPPADQVDDLVGEFSNMVCGDWLSRMVGQRAFHLSPPHVVRVGRPTPQTARRRWLNVNDQPLAVDWDIARSLGGVKGGW